MKQLQISPPPVNDTLFSSNGKASVRFQNHLSEFHQKISSLIMSDDFLTSAGSAVQTIQVNGDRPEQKASPNDFVMVTVKSAGATPRSIVSQAAGDGVITVVMSGDPGNDHVLSWALFKLS